MDHARQVELIEKVLARLDQRGSDMAGEATEIPVADYLSPDRLEREQRMIRRLPVVVGFASQVAAPGDFFTHDHSGVPLLVARDREGKLGAFLNACRHRGTRLEDAPCGSGKKGFVCPYHAWAYGTDGRLLAVPHREGFPGLDLSTRGLVRLPAAERHGLVFVQAAPGDPLAIDDYLRPFGEDFQGFDLGSHVLFAPSTRTVQMNWKLMLDGSFETYHFRTTHARTIAPLFFDNQGVFDFGEPHLRMVLPKRSIESLRGAERASWRIREHANLLYGLFPNTVVLVQPDHAMVVTTWPVALDRSVLVAGMLIPEPPKTPKAEAHWLLNEKIFWDAITEDLTMGERIQATLRSGANEHLLTARYEHLIPRVHEAIARRAT
ncbi:MAG: aromatic ring-hydroxylating dioxygenase subunit alpha [Minicystis sp.]